MVYEDLYGDMYDERAGVDDDDMDMNVTPLSDAQPDAPTGTQTVNARGLLEFNGFSSGQPFLLERPSRYLQRMRDAMRSLIVLPSDRDDPGVDARILWSPIVTLPFPLLTGTEKAANEDATRYPLLHAPINYPLPEDVDWDEYALALTLLYTASDVMVEQDTSLYTYGMHGQFEADDTVLENIKDMAHTFNEPLRLLNMARLVDFAVRDPQREQEPLTLLLDTWQDERGLQTIVDEGRDAARMVNVLYEIMFGDDITFDPFHEHDTQR